MFFWDLVWIIYSDQCFVLVSLFMCFCCHCHYIALLMVINIVDEQKNHVTETDDYADYNEIHKILFES